MTEPRVGHDDWVAQHEERLEERKGLAGLLGLSLIHI